MRLLVLSFYYPPDLCAGSFRISPLVRVLRTVLREGSQIDVVTTLPNRYRTFSVDASETEIEEGLRIRRVALPLHQSGMWDQSKAFLAYARGVRAHVSGQRFDAVFATSSRLMSAVLGASIARRQRVPLYLDIRDIFVDTVGDILPVWVARPLASVFSVLERYAIGSARKVNLVSRGFEPYFRMRYPGKPLSFFPNGIDDEFIGASSPFSANPGVPPYRVLYAGNLGEGQGLHMILPGLARAMQGRARFTVIGDGGRREQLRRALDEAGVDNVTLRSPISRSELVEEYRQSDVLFLHLNDHDAFRKVLPSKLFEYASLGKPIWAGVAGYAADFVKNEIENAAVFPPCDVDAAAAAFSTLRMQAIRRDAFVRKYARDVIMQAMARDIAETLEARS